MFKLSVAFVTLVLLQGVFARPLVLTPGGSDGADAVHAPTAPAEVYNSIRDAPSEVLNSRGISVLPINVQDVDNPDIDILKRNLENSAEDPDNDLNPNVSKMSLRSDAAANDPQPPVQPPPVQPAPPVKSGF